MLYDLLFILVGFALLIAGGELLVRGSVNVAMHLGVSPLVIGLTLVGFGTSTPELVTSVQAALIGAPGIAYGNIVGSNIANILLIGGVAALVFPIAVTSSALKRDGLFMLLVALVFALAANFFPVGRTVGAAFLLALIVYLYLAFRQERASASGNHGAAYDKGVALAETDPTISVSSKPKGSILSATLLALVGISMVIFGGRVLVDGAVAIASSLGISETIIGLTIVAIGTSMPELVTSVVAGMKKQPELAFGNIVGSNIYNILGIGGATAIFAPGGVPEKIAQFDGWIMIGVSLVFVFFALTSLRIARSEGAVLLTGYILYVYIIWP